MGELSFTYGVMGSSKSAFALMREYDYSQKGFKVLMLKPSIDTRERLSIIKSRIGIGKICVTFNPDENLENIVAAHRNTQIVIVDEVQFCTAKQIDQLKNLSLEKYTVLCYGLKTNFKGEFFEGSKRLFEVADTFVELPSICRCGEKATMNARIVNGFVTTQGAEVQIGGDESYEGLCFRCYRKYQHEKLPPRIPTGKPKDK